LNRKNAGEQIRGRPPHRSNCQTRQVAYQATYGKFTENVYHNGWI
jgi:hypothetical protein